MDQCLFVECDVAIFSEKSEDDVSNESGPEKVPYSPAVSMSFGFVMTEIEST